MSERDDEKVFRFTLHQENVLLCEKIFDASQITPFTRYSINIRHILPKSISKIQKALSRKSYDTQVEVGRLDVSDENSPQYLVDLFRYNQNLINTYPKAWREGMRYNPKISTLKLEERVVRGQKFPAKTIRGVECKLGLYLNNNTIVERTFYVDGYCPVARYSIDLTDIVVEIADLISETIKRDDIGNMWDDNDLNLYRGLTITQIRELHPAKRAEMLRRLRRY